jgi:signal transduction histidine kinase
VSVISTEEHSGHAAWNPPRTALPVRQRDPHTPRIHPVAFRGGVASLVVFLVGLALAFLLTDPDQAPPYDETLATEIGWYLMMAAFLGLVGFSVAIAVMVAESKRTQPLLRAKVAEVAALRASRGRLVDAGDAARRAIERDLHDGVQPRLVALMLNVSMARRAGQLDGASAVIDEIERELREILRDIRALASGVLPPALTDLGLEAAVTELTARMPFAVELSVPAGRLPERAEVTAYFVVAEALTNAAKHADPTRVTVRVDAHDGRVRVEVRDDGRGGVSAGDGTGLLGLADRVDTLDGRLTVVSPRGVGTTVTAEFSCAS